MLYSISGFSLTAIVGARGYCIIPTGGGADDYQALLKQYGMICSMSRKGNCWDNAVAESLFHTLKTELVYHRDYEIRREAKQEIFEYMEVFYNRKRLHSTPGYKSPADYERIANAA